jgi:hypothetical protein
MTLSIRAPYHYAEWSYAKCDVSFIVRLNASDIMVHILSHKLKQQIEIINEWRHELKLLYFKAF